MDESRCGGKHVDAQRGLVPRRIGTAVYGVLSRSLGEGGTRTHGGVGPVAGSRSHSGKVSATFFGGRKTGDGYDVAGR
jgi:hypothetical protein